MSISNKDIKKWFLHFFLMNVLLVYALSSQYFEHVFPLKLYYFDNGHFHEKSQWVRCLIEIYLFCTFIGYFTSLTLLSLTPAVLIACLTRRYWVPITIAIIGIVCLLLLLGIDQKVFTVYHFHLNQMILHILFSPYWQETFFFSKSEWMTVYAAIILLLFVEIGLALFLWFKARFDWSRWIKSLACTGILLFTISIYIAYDGNIYFIQQSRIFPYFNDIMTPLFHVTKESMNRFMTSHYYSAPQYTIRTPQYPLHPVQCQKPSDPMNIFIILVDTWRFDALNEKITPHLSQFARENLNFKRHISGANATQPGVFSLFYGLPGTYWGAFHQAKKSPELILKLIQQDYSFSIFSSTNLKMPDFETTLFNLLPPTSPPPGESSWKRDKALTQQVLSFLKGQHHQPIFSLIYYDAAHEYCGARDFSGPFYPELQTCERYKLNPDYDKTPYLNRYLNTVHALDKEINQVFQGIKKAGLWNNSIIIVTGDHGEEFNDNHLNYWGHTSNFTQYQLNVPLLIHWPGRQKQTFFHTTTHYDIVPTLMRDALHCTSPISDYSDGHHLFSAKNRYPIIVSNNYNPGYLTENTITTLFPTGDIEIREPNAKLLPERKPEDIEFQYVLKKLYRFYQ